MRPVPMWCSLLTMSVAVGLALACGGGGGSGVEEVAKPLATETAPAPSPGPEPAAPEPAAAPETAAKAPAQCRPGLVEQQGWPGEWPSPVIHVKAKTTLAGIADLCTPLEEVPCTVPPGLYHPWSSAEGALAYETLTPVTTYRLTKPWSPTEDKTWDAGTTVFEVGYLGEGFCLFQVDGEDIDGECPGVGEDDLFEKVAESDAEAVQYVKMACIEGTPMWVEANEALFDDPNVVPGGFADYGVVAPADQEGAFTF